MKWKKVYKIYVVSEEGLLKKPVFTWRMSGSIFDGWYDTEEEAIADIIAKSEDNEPWVPGDLHIIPVMIKVLA